MDINDQLVRAARNHDLARVKQCLQRGAQIEATAGPSRETALMGACHNGEIWK